MLIIALPLLVVLWACRHAVAMLGRNELIRVVFPPLVLIIAVLGSILGGITNPTPAAALGAGGALLAGGLSPAEGSSQIGQDHCDGLFAMVIMMLIGVNFDLRVGVGETSTEQWIAFVIAQAAYSFAMFGLLYACWDAVALYGADPGCAGNHQGHFDGICDPDRRHRS